MSNYDPTVFVEGGPPGISAAELNKMGGGIKAAHDELHAHETKALGVAGSHPMPPIPKAAAGLFTGDGVNGRSIAVGFDPLLVIITVDHPTAADTWTISPELAYPRGVHHLNSGAHTRRSDMALAPGGFRVGSDSNRANQSGTVYAWVALGGPQ